jgi:putative DNA primase/helicase
MMTNPIEQFREAIHASGLTPPEVIEADGKLRRFASNGRRNDDAGWYLIHDDGIPAGSFGDWRTGLAQSWRADVGRALTLAEEAEHRAKVEAMRHEREAEETRRRAEAAATAAAIVTAATPATDDHAYLVRKGIKANGALLHQRKLAIPMRADGRVHSLQFIGADGEKRFLTGGRVAGCYFSIGNVKGAAVLCVAEGFATGASIHEATGYPVAVAFNAGNLTATAQAMRARFPALPLILCADDDYRTEGNPGMTKAAEAARAVGGLLAVPDFGADRPEGATDFNDLAQLCGAESVRAAIGRAMAGVDEHATGGAAEGGAWVRAVVVPEPWGEPQPIPSALLPVKPFDVALLPATLAPWVADIAERMQCPADFPAVGAMVAASSVIGRKAVIAPQRFDDWHVVPNLWGAIVGRPGCMKSPALADALRPLDRLAAIAADRHKEALRDFEIRAKLEGMAGKAAEIQAQKLVAKGETAAAERLLIEAADTEGEGKPALRRYKVNDATMEALGEILIDNPWGTLAYRDELIGLLRSLDKEGQEGARAFYLQGYDGNQGYTSDRILRGKNLHIDAVCLALLGGIQPGKLQAYIRDAVSGGAGDDGLLQRFGLLVWPDVGKEWRRVDRWPDTEAKNQAFETFQRLDALAPGVDPDGKEIPFVYRFTDNAQWLFHEWRAGLETGLRSDDYHPAMESHLAKYRKLVPALALVCALADGKTDVEYTDLMRALSWAEYLQTHAERAYAAGTRPETDGATALLAKIRAGTVVDGFKPADVYLKGWSYLGSPEVVNSAAQMLCDLGHLRRVVQRQKQGAGRPAISYQINPATLAKG